MSRRVTNAPTVECQLCPKACRIPPGASGDCRVRVNLDGKLTTVVYGHPVAVHVDPIEKKPLYHAIPGTSILSLATVGCNLHCLNCQNWEISQADPWDTESYELAPEAIVGLAKRQECPSIAYTYTEPLVYYEYTLDTAELARDAGLKNVLVTAGYLNPEPLKRLYRVIDAANIDLKAMSDDFYRRICKGELAPVLRSLELAREAGVLVEVTNLVIPTLNDSQEMLTELATWVFEHLGWDTPLHFSGFTPRHQLRNLPRTPAETLRMARDIALEAGLHYVYIGNVLGTEGSHTRCHTCGELLIERIGFEVRTNRVANGRCPTCETPIPGLWR